MRFDEFWTDQPSASETKTDYGPMPADGRHTGTIKFAEIKDLPFKVSDENKTGTCLVVKVAIKGCQWVEDIVPVNYRGAIEAVCRAARVATTGGPADLVDAEVQIETTRAVSKKGKEYCRIKWLAGPPGIKPPVVERAVAPPAKSGRPQLGDDEIPF